jgi:hypothetical protein
MYRYLFPLTIVVLIGFLIVSKSNFFAGKTDHISKPSIKAARGTEEDPEARIRYERMRLRNPASGKIPADIHRRELEFASTLPIRNPAISLHKSENNAEALIVSNNWKLRGPYNVGGRTRALGIDVNNENIILAGGVSGGMWRSTNNGETWTRTTGPEQLHSVTCLAQDIRSGHTNTWYYGTGEYRGNSASGDGTDAFFAGDGIYKSTDNGLTWKVLSSTQSNSPETFNIGFDAVWNIAVDPSNNDQEEVYAAVYNRIYRSFDGGKTWTNVLANADYRNSPYTDVTVSSAGVVYATLSSAATGNQGIFRSEDGINWINITPGNWPPEFQRTVLAIAPSNEDIVYFLAESEGYGTNNHSLWKYEYLSGDGSGSGGQWTNQSSNLPAQGGLTGDFDSQSSYDLLIRVNPDNENTVFIGGTSLYRSTDGFSSTTNTAWIGGYDPTDINNAGHYPNQHPDQHALVFYPSNPSKAIAGHDGGLSLTSNILASNVAWQILNNGYYTAQFYTCAIDHEAANDNLIMGGMQDNGTYMVNSSSSTAAWNALLGGDGAFCAIGNGSGKKFYYTSWQNGGIYRFASDNLDWARIDPAGGSDYLFINPFILDRNDAKIMYLAGGTILWRNNDVTSVPKDPEQLPATLNWEELNNSEISAGIISALDISISTPNRLYYATSLGDLFRLDDANSGDPEPVDITSDSFPGGYISSVSVDPDNADNVMISFSNYEVISIWYSNNGGSTWQNVSGDLEENPDGSGSGPAVNWVEILPTDLGVIYFAGTSTGLYSSIELNGNSTQWLQEGATTIGNVVVDMVDSRTTDDLVVAATHGNGMYSAKVSVETAIDTKEENIATDFKLSQNYPNPFNPNTTIEYRIPNSSPVTLKIYNIQGQEIATLVNANHPAGKYSVTWNGKDRFGRPVASGTYIYQITAGKYRESRQMVLMK